MATRRVYLRTVASASVDVEVPDDLDEAEARHRAIEDAYQDAPGLCAHCSGWGQVYSMDLGEWESEDDPDNGAVKED